MFLILNQNDRTNLVKDNYMYRSLGVLKSGEERWRCTVKNCSGRVYTYENGTLLSRQEGQHNHVPRGENQIWRIAISNSIKRKANEDIDERPSKLVHNELAHNKIALDSLTRRDMKCIRDNITNARLKKFPKLPKSSLEVQQTLSTIDIKTTKDEDFLLVNDTAKGITIFSCETNLKNLCDRKTLLMDGTFEYAPKYFTQLFTIHGYNDSTYVPLVFCLLPDKKMHTYTQVLTLVKRACEQRNLHFQPSSIVVDFERAIHQSLAEVFPDARIVGCRFHLGQAWWRKIQALGLSSTYKNKESEEGKWLNYCFGLTYLNPEDVEDVFLDLLAIQPASEKLTSFADYLTETYVDETSAPFPPKIWAEHTADLWRTTNACESFHSRFNNQCSTPHPNIYVFLKNLKSIQIDCYLRLNTTEVPKSRKKTCSRQLFLVDKFNQLRLKEVNMLHFTKCVGYRNSPQV